MTAFGISMPSQSHLGLRMLVEHLANSPIEATLTSNDTALDHMMGQGNIVAVMATANLTPEKRERFLRNVLKVIENDLQEPVEHSLARLAWLVPAFTDREPTKPVINKRTKRAENLFDQLATLAVLQKAFDAQITVLALSNNLPPGARGMLDPIGVLGLYAGIIQTVVQTQNALLDDPGPLKHFLALAEVAAPRCNYEEYDEEFGTLQHLRERVNSMDVLARKLNMGLPTPPYVPENPPASGRRRKPPNPRRDPP